ASKVTAYIMAVGFLGLFGYGIFAGFKLREGSAALPHLRLYFSLPIPFISLPFIAYRFFSRFEATLAINPPSFRWGWDWGLGSEWQFVIHSSAHWGFGINLVALAIVFLLNSRLAVAPKMSMSRALTQPSAPANR